MILKKLLAKGGTNCIHDMHDETEKHFGLEIAPCVLVLDLSHSAGQ